MFKAVWKLLLMLNGVSSDEDERRAAQLRCRRERELSGERANQHDVSGVTSTHKSAERNTCGG
ncbi:MAG: hypothetical protein EA376_04935 [Phycisphaeraceae bacterium]|nr:MAG: hypothetical protein EA376_04935 [Phycisphaeraceae bacterium]